ncbi:MAG: MFS transporter [Pseudonocardia sp. SCN 73-27]|nr:MAG: MFS transporter [Pseudonocardia sp. SCN 72-51]ODV09248.1 MAG: MFS transporter [Pseudonocardia sp. SCN 73-27]
MGTVCLGAFMGQLDASIVTLIYQPLQVEFGVSLAAVQWVSLAYLLGLTALLIPVGRLADVHGRKLTYTYGFVVFSLASLACGLAPSLAALTGFRLVQALGAALLQANSVALVTTSAPEGRRRAALGVQAAAQALGLALGPTIGGILVSTLGWRWVFGINVPIGAVAVVAGLFLLPRTRHRTAAGPWDHLGTLLLAASTTTLLLGMSVVAGLGPPAWVAAPLLVVAAAAAAAFVARQRRATTPLLDRTLVADRTVAYGLLGALCGYLVLFGPLVLVPLVVTRSGGSAMHAGLVLTALPAGFALAAAGAERVLPPRWTDRRRSTAGAALAVAALAALLVVPLTAPWMAGLLALLGLGLGLFSPANNSQVMGAISLKAAATGGGLVNMARSLGTALGVALVTLALSVLPGPTGGPRLAVAILAGAALAAVLTTRATGHEEKAEHGEEVNPGSAPVSLR